MMPGMNPKQMQKMMKQMGMKQDDLNAVHAEIILADGRKLVFENPEVAKVNMMGQDTYQLSGEATEVGVDSMPDISDEDLETIIEQTGCSLDEAKTALIETNGDLAEAIMKLA
jgi:nascent polypeptide-associated complex subunit alpha